ncbi:MAG TPA: methyltransferase domain-containing protein [Thermomicrobiales bacterium]|nr:methyltransferase domain-containing protein [Thermomicrobiales bacterium]
MWNGQEVSVVLGTYAEKDSIRAVIDAFFATGVVDEVVVVNNNAEPGTTEEVDKTRARQVFESKQGYGHAYQRGLAEATGDLIILAEPDGTFLPRDAIKLLTYADDCDAVFGTRTTRELIWTGANMGPFLKWGNWAVAKLVEVLFNTSHLSDVGCTYRLITRETLEKIQGGFSVGGSHFGPELMLLVIASGARVVEVPVNYLPRVGTSSVTGDLRKAVKLGLQMIGFIIMFRLRVARKGRVKPSQRRVDGAATMGRSDQEMASSASPLQTTGVNGQTDFDTVADAYDDSLPAHVMRHYIDKRVAFIREHVPIGSKILDVGCGTGVLAERLLREGYDVTGADPFAAMLDRMRARDPRLKTVQASGQRLPFDDNSFDLTYCVAVMHHIADPKDVRDTLVEMCRVTKPGGYVLVWDHNPRNPYWPILMNRVPQDTGAERLIPEREILDGMMAGGATRVVSKTLGLMPDFTPKILTAPVASLERIVERTPGLNRFCAHNVVLARKNG